MNATAKENTVSFQKGQKVFLNDIPATVSDVNEYSVCLAFDSGNLVSMGVEAAAESVTTSPRIPKVGDGATQLCYSDRHAFTVEKVSPSGKTFWARRDKATRTDSNGMSEAQSYTFEPDPTAVLVQVRLTKRGWKAGSGDRFSLGTRREYHDYSF